jgi:Rrf2 family protein
MSTSSRFAVAVHALALMARAGDEPVKSEGVAASVNTNPVVIRRLLCELAHADLVVSQKGAYGGTKLARKPEEITLLDVYRAVEGKDVFRLQRHRPSANCPVGAGVEAVLHGVLDEVNGAVEEVLATRTMDDVLQSSAGTYSDWDRINHPGTLEQHSRGNKQAVHDV